MSPHTRADDGFGLVEVIIAMVLLAIIAMALLPALWNGIRYSAEQSSVATATRQVNAVVEQIRGYEKPTCTDIQHELDLAAVARPDGRNGSITVRLKDGQTLSCTPGNLIDLPLEAMLDGKSIASVHGKVFVP